MVLVRMGCKVLDMGVDMEEDMGVEHIVLVRMVVGKDHSMSGPRSSLITLTL